MIKILITLTLMSEFIFCQGFGIGGGLGANGFSISGNYLSNGYNEDGWLLHIGLNLFNGRNEENTYDFSPSLFDDSEKGKLKEAVWFCGGYSKVVSSSQFIIGGGLSNISEYYKRYDDMEILGDGDGTYFVEDDANNKVVPTLLLGIMFKPEGNNTWGIKRYSIFLNTSPIDISFLINF